MVNQIALVLFWGLFGFAVFIAASYIGTKLALREYFGDGGPQSDFVRLDDGNEGR